MTIKRTEKYQTELLSVLKNIANDKITASKKFKIDLNNNKISVFSIFNRNEP